MAYATNSNGGYSGTIVASPIRPSSPSQNIATVFSNEVKGGHHSYETLSERNSIIENRREWGMLCTVYNDGTNNKTYILQYDYSNTTITDNDNWILYNPAGLDNINIEWVDSIKEIASTPTSYVDGERWLIESGTGSYFAGHDNEVAEWDSTISGGLGGFIYTTPLNGMTVRDDSNNNILLKYNGSIWEREYLNQIRYVSSSSINGLSYSGTSSLSNQIKAISYDSCIFYATFSSINSGTVSINIDTIGDIEIKKLINNSFYSLSSGDLVTDITYQLIYNSGFLQTTLPSSSTTTIGSAEDSYIDGLYTDFTTTTPIGTAVDRFNEILKYLAPESAPVLSSWSASGTFVNGGLSFDNSTGGFVSATQSPYGSVASGGTFSNVDSIYRLGITSKVTQPLTGNSYYNDITGVLNSLVDTSSALPTPSYIENSFGYGLLGTVSMYLNGISISEVGLTSGASIDTSSSGATSGLSISTATSSKFNSGYAFDMYMNRTGTFTVKKDSILINDGYNYLIIRHDTGSASYILNRFEWVADSYTTNTTVQNPILVSPSITTGKYISGINYIKTPTTIIYSGTIQNLFGNTFNTSSNGVMYNDLTQNLTGITNSVTNTLTNTNYPAFTPSFTYSKIKSSGSYAPSSTMPVSMTFSLSTNVRRINESIGFSLDVLRTVQGTFSGGTPSSSGTIPVTSYFIDSYTETSTDLLENFDDEVYRLQNQSGTNDKYDSFHVVANVYGFSAYTWDKYASLISSSTHKNGLQIINGTLVYPTFNFGQPGPGNISTNPNYNVGASVNYSNGGSIASPIGMGTYSGSPSTQNRTYTRYFSVGTSINYSKIRINMLYNGVTFVNSNIPLTSNPNSDIWVEVKLVYDNTTGVPPAGLRSSGSVTGWLDATKPFNLGDYEDGDGCMEGTNVPSSGLNWDINFGYQGTKYSGGYILIRITAGPDWTGNINSIQVSPI